MQRVLIIDVPVPPQHRGPRATSSPITSFMSRDSETGGRCFQKARRKIDKELKDISEVILDAVKKLMLLLEKKRWRK